MTMVMGGRALGEGGLFGDTEYETFPLSVELS